MKLTYKHKKEITYSKALNTKVYYYFLLKYLYNF